MLAGAEERRRDDLTEDDLAEVAARLHRWVNTPNRAELVELLAQVMRDANTPEAWTQGSQIVPFDHFAAIAYDWVAARVRAQIADEIAATLERCAVQSDKFDQVFTADTYRASAAIAREHAGVSSNPRRTRER
jgi:hypothetical protein